MARSRRRSRSALRSYSDCHRRRSGPGRSRCVPSSKCSYDSSTGYCRKRRSRSRSGGRRRLPPALRRWNRALSRAKKEMGILKHDLVFPKKRGGDREQGQLYRLTRDIYDGSY